MWRILLESLKKGVLAPPEPPSAEPPARFRGEVTLDAGRCDQSGDCARVCPTGAITLTDDPAERRKRWRIDHARCIFCGLCEEVCPRQAIALTREFRLAVTNKHDLETAVTFMDPDRRKGP